MSPSEAEPMLRRIVRDVSTGRLPDGPLVCASERREIRDELAARLRADLEGLPCQSVRLSSHSVEQALRCAAWPDAPFEVSLRTTTRAIALEAFTVMQDSRGLCAVDAVREAMRAAIGAERWYARWLLSLDAPGRAAVAASAASRASRVSLAVDPGDSRFVVPTSKARTFPLGELGPVSTEASHDMLLRLRRAGGLDLVLVAFARSDLRGAALSALFASLRLERVPLRHVTVDTASGEVSAVDISPALLRAAMEEAVAAGTAIGARLRGEAAALPGLHCLRCVSCRGCTAGTEFVSTAALRRHGVPLPRP